MRFVALSLLVLAGPAGAAKFTMEQARATAEEHVRRTTEGSGGVYRLPDGPDGSTLELEFVRVSLVSAGNLWSIHDPDRSVGADAFFACTLFHVPGEPQEKVYDVDMLIESQDGKLAVTEVRVHKEKQLVRGKWVWVERTRASAGGTASGGATQR